MVGFGCECIFWGGKGLLRRRGVKVGGGVCGGVWIFEDSLLLGDVLLGDEEEGGLEELVCLLL